jgi:hypothetical protein
MWQFNWKLNNLYSLCKGKNLMKNWFSKHDDIYCGMSYIASTDGWMEMKLFTKWFSPLLWGMLLVKKARKEQKIVLSFDGNVSLDLAKLAMKNNVILAKFPPNLTHVIQPLDRTCFRPLKEAWNKL